LACFDLVFFLSDALISPSVTDAVPSVRAALHLEGLLGGKHEGEDDEFDDRCLFPPRRKRDKSNAVFSGEAGDESQGLCSRLPFRRGLFERERTSTRLCRIIVERWLDQ
jgi:hypothetical protein